MRYRVVTTYLMYLLLLPSLAQKLRARVVNGSVEAGRLEIFYKGAWNTVCEHDFGTKEALVACRMLGFNSTTAVAVGSAKYGRGSSPILLNNLRCVGNETSLAQCQHSGLYRNYCEESENVGIMCNIILQIAVRLVNGTSEAGRLEIFYNKEWGTVCDEGFGNQEALVICRMLGFKSTGAAAISSATYGRSSNQVILQQIKCLGTETSLEECKFGLFLPRSCRFNSNENVGIICNITEPMRVRLVNGTSEAGRLEIFFNREWNTVCLTWFRYWEDHIARVVCRMLGFNSTRVAAVSSFKYGQGSGHILLKNPVCPETATILEHCSNGLLYPVERCDHSRDIGVDCNITEQRTARLVNGTSAAGRLEVSLGGEWTTVCASQVDKREALVACRMLGFNRTSTKAIAVSTEKYGQGSGLILELGNLNCRGTETSLMQCDFGYTGPCDHSADIGVNCNSNEQVKVRLVNGTMTAGRLEISYGGEWYAVCDTEFKKEEVDLVCRMLGINSSSSIAMKSLIYGESSGFRFQYLDCDGTETHIKECDIGEIKKDCWKSVDVAVICDFSNFSLRLAGTGRTRLDMGRVELETKKEQYGTLCVSNRETANVICRQLGLPSENVDLIDGWPLGRVKSSLLEFLFICEGHENNLFQCTVDVTDTDCRSLYLGVFCSKDGGLFIVSDRDAYPLIAGQPAALMCLAPRRYEKVHSFRWPETAGGYLVGELLNFDNITKEHNGRQVMCGTMRNYGLVTSKILELEVYSHPLITIIMNDSQIKPLEAYSNRYGIIPGHNATIWCEADSNPPPASIQWSGKINSTTGELRITVAEQKTHSGVYTCTVATKTVDGDDRLPLMSSHQLILTVQGSL